MKTKKQIAAEHSILNESSIYTLNEFMDLLDDGTITSYDGWGYFHDGENETRLNVWDNSLTWDDVKDFPYVCWYNK